MGIAGEKASGTITWAGESRERCSAPSDNGPRHAAPGGASERRPDRGAVDVRRATPRGGGQIRVGRLVRGLADG